MAALVAATHRAFKREPALFGLTGGVFVFIVCSVERWREGLMARVLGISGFFNILDETCLVVWIGDEGFPTYGPQPRFAAIDPRQREAMAKRSLATEDDWRSVIKSACDAADRDESKPDVCVVLFDPGLAAKLFPRPS